MIVIHFLFLLGNMVFKAIQLSMFCGLVVFDADRALGHAATLS